MALEHINDYVKQLSNREEVLRRKILELETELHATHRIRLELMNVIDEQIKHDQSKPTK